jgi:hypothetical protein
MELQLNEGLLERQDKAKRCHSLSPYWSSPITPHISADLFWTGSEVAFHSQKVFPGLGL